MRCIVVFQLLSGTNNSKWQKLFNFNSLLVKELGYDYFVTPDCPLYPKEIDVVKIMRNMVKIYQDDNKGDWSYRRAFSWLNVDPDCFKDYDYVILSDLDGFVLWDNERLCAWSEKYDISAFSYTCNYQMAFEGNNLSAGFLIFKRDVFQRFLTGIKSELNECLELGFDIFCCKLQAYSRFRKSGFDEWIYAQSIKNQEITELKTFRDIDAKINDVILLSYFDLTNKSVHNRDYTKDFQANINGQYMWCHVYQGEHDDNIINRFRYSDNKPLKSIPFFKSISA